MGVISLMGDVLKRRILDLEELIKIVLGGTTWDI